jgi:hypothetical protein
VLGRGEALGRQRGDVPGAVDRGPERGDALHVHGFPGTEGALADPLPELAVREGRPAGAHLVADQVPLPQVGDLAEGDHAGELAQQALQERRAAAAQSPDEDHLHAIIGLLGRIGDLGAH